MLNGAQKLGRDPRAELISVDREQVSRKFKRALIIDDEVEYANSIKGNLEAIGFEAKVLGSLDAAAHELFQRGYPLIICDNIFVNRSNTRGSVFIRDHAELLGSGKVILMTGYPEKHIVDSDLLKLRGVVILKKGLGAIDQLKQLCTSIVDTLTQQFTAKLTELCGKIVEEANDLSDLDNIYADSYLVQRAKTYLINYMKMIPKPDTPQFVILGTTYSPNRLIDEIQQGTEVSRLLIDQLLDDILEPTA